MLKVENLRVTVGDREILKGVNISVDNEGFHVIMAPTVLENPPSR